MSIRTIVARLVVSLLPALCCFAQENTNWDRVAWERVIHHRDWVALSRMINSTNSLDQLQAAFAVGYYATNLPSELVSAFGRQLGYFVTANRKLLQSSATFDSPAEFASAKTNTAMAIVSTSLDSLAVLGERATNTLGLLQEILESEHFAERLRWGSFKAISRIAPNSTADTRAMSICLNSKSDMLFGAALDRFASFPIYRDATNFIPLVVRELSQPDRMNQWRIIQALGSAGRGSPTAVNALRRGLTSTNAENRAAAIKALYVAEAVSADDIKQLGKLLSDTNQLVRLHAAEVLGLLPGNSAVVLAELERATADSDKKVAETARVAVQRINSLSQPRK